MRFIEKRRRIPAIPLVSLIDILTILLLFFVMTAEFRADADKKKAEEKQKRERRLEISLPGVSQIEGQAVSDTRTPISLTSDDKVLLDGKEVPIDGLVQALKEARQANPQTKFELEPDERVPLGTVVKVWDALTKAGIQVGEVPARVLKKP